MFTSANKGAAAVLALILAGCATGPQYVRPTVQTPPAYKELGGWKTGQPKDDALRGKWWEAFGDAQLNALEERVNISNQNIAAAAAAFRTARATVREARAQYYPSVTAGASVTNSHLVIPQAAGTPVGKTYNEYSLPIDASWEPDLWNRVRKTVEAGALAAQVSAADLENVRLAAHAELAVDYYELRAEDSLRQLLNSTAAAYRETADLNRALFSAGVGTDEATAQAETQMQTTEAQAENTGIQRAQYEHAIAVLIGEPASAFGIPVAELRPNSPAVPVGVPAGLLERRPDIASAERAAAEASARIGLAKTAYYPNITLSASGGFQSLSLVSLPARFWSLGPSLVETIFDGGLRKATVQQFQAAYEQTVASYRQTVLAAFGEVEDNLAALRVLSQVVAMQDEAIRTAGRALGEAEARYRGGLDPYLNVLSAQTVMLNAQQTALNFRALQMADTVQLIKALGGGWDASQLPPLRELEASPTRRAK
jgi:NodT family efflux transporter outer membrane factor (OMF) lipoprotein